MTSNRLIAIALGIILIFAAPVVRPVSADSPWLGGTWWTTVTPPPEAGAPAFKLLFTFNEDGNLLASGTAGGDVPGLGNPCHGTWARHGTGFSVTYLCFDFDPSFQLSGYDKLRGNLSVDPRGRLIGNLAITHYDAAENEVFS